MDKISSKALDSIKNYLNDFSSKESHKCSTYWTYPSSLICDKQSSIFFSNEKDCISYYSKLFFALSLMNYKRTEIINITAESISKNNSYVNLHAQRVDKNLGLIKKLNCIYILNYDPNVDRCFIKSAICE